MPNFSRRAALAAIASSVVATAYVGATPAHALEEDAAKAFVEDVANRVVSLARSNQSFEQKRVAFRDLMAESAMIDRIAQVTLGAPWRQMTDAQKAEYQSLFPEYLSKIYTRRFDDYKGETLKVVDALSRKKSVFVSTRVQAPNADPLSVTWRVSDRAGSILIEDIVIEGISLVATQREDFKGLYEQSGSDIDQFLATLRERAA